MATITPSANDKQQSLHAVACLITGSQRAAVATIALQGDDAQAALQHFFTATRRDPYMPMSCVTVSGAHQAVPQSMSW